MHNFQKIYCKLQFIWYNIHENKKEGGNRMHLDAPTQLFLRLPAHAADYSFHNPAVQEPDWYCGNTRKIGCVYHNHIHREVEIHHVIYGHVHVKINGVDRLLSAGDILILNPYDNHEGWIAAEEAVRFQHAAFDLQKFASACGDSVRTAAAGICAGTVSFANIIRCEDATAPLFAEAVACVCQAYRTAQNDPVIGDLRMMAGISNLLICLFTNGCMFERKDTSRSLEFIRAISEYTEAHYAEETTTGTMAKVFGYSEGHFCALFRRNFGMTFCDYLNRYRIARAVDFGRDGRLALTELAQRVGYTNYGYFSRCFKQYTGLPPSEYFAAKPNLVNAAEFIRY